MYPTKQLAPPAHKILAARTYQPSTRRAPATFRPIGMKGTSSVDEEGQQPGEDWRDNLMGMQPHERAEAYEEREMFREALKWHREDLVAARARALDLSLIHISEPTRPY